MVDSSVKVRICYKNENILEDNSTQVDKNDLKELLNVLKDTQKKTNDCLTRLIKETDTISRAEEKSYNSGEDSSFESDEDDDNEKNNFEKLSAADINEEVIIIPKRAKLKN